MSRRLRVTALGLVAVAAVVLPAAQPSAVRAAEYTLQSDARYTLNVDAREIAVSVDLRFENTTPNPPGQFSAFDVIDLAVQEGAESVTAQDAGGPLGISTSAQDGFLLVSVSPRDTVRYQDVVELTLTYVLPDGGSDALRIRPSVVLFPAWSFGTSGTVTVVLPEEYDVRVDGSTMSAEHQDGSVVLTSDAITDPRGWLARITATRPSSFTTVARTVPLAGGTVDLQVRAWADDQAWGRRVANLLATALPVLEEEIGLEYPRLGALVVVESVPDPATPTGEPEPGTAEIGVAFDEPDFTVLHQAAHVWLTPQLAADPWIREGFASAFAQRVAARLEVPLPFDPAERAGRLASAAFPLVSWGTATASAQQNDWAYAASWDFANRMTSTLGVDRMTLVWRRIAGGVAAYEPVVDEPPAVADGSANPVDSRELLDQLEEVSGADLADKFAATVFDADTTALLPARAEARAAYVRLLTAAGDWGAPDPVRGDLAAWQFDDAASSTAAAEAWLDARNAMFATLDDLGLTPPARLRDQFRAFGGRDAARTELEAEQAVVDAYRDAQGRVAGWDRPFLARVGLVGAAKPSELLTQAGARFSEGDLRGAAAAIDTATATLQHATLDGAVRLASAVAIVLVLVAGLVLVLRRRRATGYTPAQ